MLLQRNRLYFLHVDAPHKEQRHSHRHKFGNYKAPPHVINVPGKRKKVCRRKKYYKLARKRYNHTVYGRTERLEHGRKGNGDCRTQKTWSNAAQAVAAKFNHFVTGIKKAEQPVRKQLEQGGTETHNRKRHKQGGTYCIRNALVMLCAVVVGNNRNDAVIKAEYRHKDKAVQLKIDAVDGNRSSTEPSKNNVHKIRYDRGD